MRAESLRLKAMVAGLVAVRGGGLVVEEGVVDDGEVGRENRGGRDWHGLVYIVLAR